MSSIYRRMIFRFFSQLAFTFLLLLLSLLITFAIIGYLLFSTEVNHSLNAATNEFIADRVIVAEDGTSITITKQLEDLITKQQGWLLVYGENGKLRTSYYVPEDITPRLTDMLQPQHTTYSYTSWSIKPIDTEETLLVMFGQHQDAYLLLEAILPAVNWNDHKWQLDPSTEQWLEKLGASAWLLSNTGETYAVANSEPKHWSTTDMQALQQNKELSVAVHTNPSSADTLMVMVPNPEADTSSPAFMQKLTNPLLLVLVIMLLLFVMGSLWYASYFGTPLLAFVRWIGHLGNGIYTPPTNKYGQSIIYQKNGKLKKKVRFYREIVMTLEQVSRTLEQDEKERQKMKKTREEWISGLSHDLKTPLSSIMGYVKMLQSDQYDWSAEEKQAFLQTIDEKSNYMFELMEDLTLTYRLKNDSLPLVKETVNLNELIRRSIIELINMTNIKTMNYEFTCSQEDLMLSLDPKWWQRILDNILMNAIQYNPAGTTITINTDILANHLAVITITDNGNGMDEHTLNQLFQRYYRGNNTQESTSGTGLGMAITKQLVKLHGGSVQVTSSPGSGTRFRILLPM